MLSTWREHGVLILENFIPKDSREQYFEVRQAPGKPGGWSDPCPYLYVPELRHLSMYPPLLNVLDALIGYEMGLHLNLTGWVTTGRAWHQGRTPSAERSKTRAPRWNDSWRKKATF